jgi:hypothetical protein
MTITTQRTKMERKTINRGNWTGQETVIKIRWKTNRIELGVEHGDKKYKWYDIKITKDHEGQDFAADIMEKGADEKYTIARAYFTDFRSIGRSAYWEAFDGDNPEWAYCTRTDEDLAVAAAQVLFNVC